MRTAFTESDVPSMDGKSAVVTGANGGLGLETARVLAARGADVVLACRNPAKADDALARIRREAPGAKVAAMALDLADLASVRRFAEALRGSHARLDLLVNNAGVMALPRATTKDGFEMQLGTNHLGHFALTAQLLPLLQASAAARVVTVSSLMHNLGFVRWDDLQGERSYQRWLAYGQSKLANLLFAYELDRRLKARSPQVISLACHPGMSSTELVAGGPNAGGMAWLGRTMVALNSVVAQSAADGALPTLRAASDPSLRGGEYIGPRALFETRGAPVIVRSNRRSHDAEAAAKLWTVSEELTRTRMLD